MNITDRRAGLVREIAEIGAFYERECRLAQEPALIALADLDAMFPHPIFIAFDPAQDGSERTAFLVHGDSSGAPGGCFHVGPSYGRSPAEGALADLRAMQAAWAEFSRPGAIHYPVKRSLWQKFLDWVDGYHDLIL